jgi:uncharacterized phage infection (PIP) family protein YhgE
MMLLGVVLVVGSSVLIATQHDVAGFSPQSLMLLGAVLFATSVTHRRIVAQHSRREVTEQLSSLDNEALLQITLSLQSLADAHRQGGLPLAADDLQQISRALQRQDEKINNLTKAMKMYGKPLMEITGQGAELYSSLAVVKTAVEAGGEAANKGLARIEQQLRALDTQKPAISPELQASLTKATAKIASLDEKLDEKSNRTLEPLQKQLGRLESTVGAALEKIENNDSNKRLQRIESSVAAAVEKFENNDSSKRLQRIEEATKKAREDVQELMRGPDIEKVVAQLQDRLDKSTARLADGLQKMREDSISELAVQIREVQREITGLAKSVAQVQAAVRSGPVRAEAPAPAYVGPATVAPRPSASTPSPSPAPAAAGTTPTATGEYQTGKRATSSKNVLGAIAKLKQMKG